MILEPQQAALLVLMDKLLGRKTVSYFVIANTRFYHLINSETP